MQGSRGRRIFKTIRLWRTINLAHHETVWIVTQTAPTIVQRPSRTVAKENDRKYPKNFNKNEPSSIHCEGTTTQVPWKGRVWVEEKLFARLMWDCGVSSQKTRQYGSYLSPGSEYSNCTELMFENWFVLLWYQQAESKAGQNTNKKAPK